MAHKRREDGYYQRSITIGRHPDGRPVRKVIYAKTVKELEAKTQEYARRFKHGAIADERITFSELAGMWVRDYTSTASEKVRRDYIAIIRNHLAPVIGSRKVLELKKHDLQALLNWLAGEGMSHSTMQKIKIVAAGVLELAADNDVIPRNVFEKVKVPEGKTAERPPITEEQRRLILSTWQDHRMGLPALLMLFCGLRRGELLALTWNDIDLVKKELTVNKAVHYISNAPQIKEPKSAAGKRVVPIPDAILPALAKARHSALLVCPSVETGGLMSAVAYKRAWESYLHYLNIKAGGRDASRSNPKIQAVELFTAHQLRHTYATMLYDAGVDVLTAQRLLGHADAKTTMEIYTHLSKKKEQHSIAALNAHIGAVLH